MRERTRDYGPFITHDMASARNCGPYCHASWKGRIIWEGSKDKIDQSGNPYVDQFIHGRAEGPIKMQVRKL